MSQYRPIIKWGENILFAGGCIVGVHLKVEPTLLNFLIIGTAALSMGTVFDLIWYKIFGRRKW